MAVVGIECNGAVFLTSFQEGPHQKLFFQGFFFQNSACKMANCIIVDIVNYHLQNLSSLFFFLSLKYGVRMRKNTRK